MPRHPIAPTPLDDVRTSTSSSQVSTELDISSYLLSWLNGDDDGEVHNHRSLERILLSRQNHVAYVSPQAFDLPSHMVVLDASRSWIMYWVVGALSTLGVKLDDEERLKAVKTVLSFQHPHGGFGGGPGQTAHLASTYASLCALATLLDGADQSLVDQTCAQIDLMKMYQWILSLKLPDGSFAMHHGGEIDVRGCFSAMVIATLLNLLTPELVSNVTEYLVSCQTFEGGMSATSIPAPHVQQEGIALIGGPGAAPTGEAHGGYTLCALTAYFLLQGLPTLSDSPKINHQSCLRWAVQMQGLPIEGGGFRGRTNKLVDGCYSWWCGGLFPLLQALIWPDSADQQSIDLFDRQAVQEYILLISQDLKSQNTKGGLRDKPTMSPDLYHTHYILAGLSIAQNFQQYSVLRIQQFRKNFKAPDCAKCILGDSEPEVEAIERMKEIYSRALGWEVIKEKELVIGPISNRTVPAHPVFNMKASAVESLMNYFYHQN